MNRETAIRQLEQLALDMETVADGTESSTVAAWAFAVRDSLRHLTTPEEPPENTARVRVGVVVDRDGDWQAYGYTGAEDAEHHAQLDPQYGDVIYWLTADLAIPGEPDREGAIDEVTRG